MVHLIRGKFLASLLPKHWICAAFEDTLTVGECSTDIDRHTELRQTLFASSSTPSKYEDVNCLEQLLQDATPLSLTIWLRKDWADSLFLWWLLHSIELLSRKVNQISVVQVPGDADYSIYQAEELDLFFESATNLETDDLKTAATLWNQYAKGNPPGISDRDGTRCSEIIGIKDFLDGYSQVFPQRIDGRLSLSVTDTVLLKDIASHDGSRPYDMIKRLEGHFHVLPTSYVASRLADWAKAELLEERVRQDGRNSITRVEYYVTDRLRDWLETNSFVPEEVPSTLVGGILQYNPKEFWFYEQSNRSFDCISNR